MKKAVCLFLAVLLCAGILVFATAGINEEAGGHGQNVSAH